MSSAHLDVSSMSVSLFMCLLCQCLSLCVFYVSVSLYVSSMAVSLLCPEIGADKSLLAAAAAGGLQVKKRFFFLKCCLFVDS
jgi:hypothetical protein